MKFYEFNKCEYYALIGAESEDKAVEYYKTVVADMGDKDENPRELTRYQAKKTVMFSIKNWNEKFKFHFEFESIAAHNEPCLLLVDGGLL